MKVHGMDGTAEHCAWTNMLTRCRNPNYWLSDDYSGRGITVCTRWLSFENFFADMGLRPDGCTLDRINNDKGYEPGNCRWATPRTQSINRRKFRNNTTGYIGVYRSYKGRFQASVADFGRNITIGTFDDPETAAWYRDQWALQVYGDSTTLNFDYEEVV